MDSWRHDEDPAEAIRRDLIAIGLDGDLERAPKLAAYLNLLARWGATYNLIGAKESAKLRTQHLADCLAAIPFLRKTFIGQPTIRALDVGSGAGLPGLVLAILQPAWQVDCVDSVGKKAAFIRQAAGQLELPNLRAIHTRAESISPPSGYDLIISRAFSSLHDFVEITRALLKVGGIWVAMKGKLPSQELGSLPDDVIVTDIQQISVPGLMADRCLISMKLIAEKSDRP